MCAEQYHTHTDNAAEGDNTVDNKDLLVVRGNYVVGIRIVMCNYLAQRSVNSKNWNVHFHADYVPSED